MTDADQSKSPNSSPETDAAPGTGAPSIGVDPYAATADMRLANRAIVNGWDIPDDALRFVPKAALEIIFAREGEREGTGPDNRPYKYSERSRLRAMQVLTRMHEQNMALSGVDRGAAGGSVTLTQLVRIVESQKRCEVVDDDWLRARGLLPPAAPIDAVSEPADADDSD